jgi:hypothetical protein
LSTVGSIINTLINALELWTALTSQYLLLKTKELPGEIVKANLPRAFKMEAQIRVAAVLHLLHNILVKIGEITEEEIGNAEGEIEGGDEEDLSENTQTRGEGYRIGRREKK